MISQRASGSVAILLPRFREETVDADTAGLVHRVQELAASGNRELVVDLSDTKECVDDVAGALMKASVLYDGLGGRVVVTGVSKGLSYCLRLLKLDQVIEFYDTGAEAIASFGGR